MAKQCHYTALAAHIRGNLVAKHTGQKAVEQLLTEQGTTKQPCLDTPNDFTIARKVMLETCEGVSNAVTKTSMLMTTAPNIAAIKEAAGASLCNAMLKPCEQLITAMTVLFLCKTDTLLAMYYARAVRNVLECVAKLYTQCATFAAQAAPSSSTDVQKQLLPLTGAVWAAVKAMSDLPLSNRIVFKRDMMQKIDIMKDTISEFHDMLQESDASMDVEGAAAANGDDDEDEFSPEESTRTKKCLAAIELLMGVCKGSVKCISLLPKDEGVSGVSDALKDMSISGESASIFRAAAPFACAKSLHTHVSDVSVQVADLGCSLYPTHDVEEVNENVGALLASGQKIFASLLVSGVIDDAQKAGLQRMENKLVVYVAEVQEKRS
jgi:hypothetical protein